MWKKACEFFADDNNNEIILIGALLVTAIGSVLIGLALMMLSLFIRLLGAF